MSWMYVISEFADCFRRIGLESIDDVFNFAGGENLTKENLAAFRQRIKFDVETPKKTLFLKRYENTPAMKQIQNWLLRSRLTMMDCDRRPAEFLSRQGINVPKTIAYGAQRCGFFEKRSFIITEKIPNAESLEKKMPDIFFTNRKKFIENLAAFINKFHQTGFRHRDLYLCHIFCDDSGNFTLIDLHRVFRPLILRKKFLIKDLAQLYYSSPKSTITRADRLRFYLAYTGKKKLSIGDLIFIGKIKSKAKQMAGHDKKYNRSAPFEN